MHRRLSLSMLAALLILVLAPCPAPRESIAASAPIARQLAADPDLGEPNDTCAQAIELPSWPSVFEEYTFHSPTDVDWFLFDGPGGATSYSLSAWGDGNCFLELYRADCRTLVASGQNALYRERAPEGTYLLKITAVGGWTGSYYPAMGEVSVEACVTFHVYRTGTQLGLANATLSLWEIHDFPVPYERLVATRVTGPDGAWRYCTFPRSSDHFYNRIVEEDPPGCVSTGAEGELLVEDFNTVRVWLLKGDDETVIFYDTPPMQMTLAPTGGASCVGSVQPFVASVTDVESASRISAVEYVVDSGSWLVDAVYLRYDHTANLLYLRNDDNSGWLGGYAPGSSHVLENSRARVHVAQCAARTSGDGKTLNVTWAVESLSSFAGSYNQFLFAERGPELYLGFDDMGDWTVSYCGSPTPTPTPTATLPQWSCGLHTLQYGVDGYVGTQDVGISSWYPDENYDGGTHDVMPVRAGDQAAGLIRFDLNSVPQSATITRATLSLYAGGWHDPPPPAGRVLTVSAFEVYRPWLAGEATWKSARSGVLWGSPGANDTTTDRAAQSATSLAVAEVGRWYDLDVTSLVQKWVSDPATNQGVVLKGAGAGIGVELVTMEHGSVALHPKLVIECQMPATATATATPSATATATASGTPTDTLTSTPSVTPTSTASPVATATPTETPTAAATRTPEWERIWLPLLLKP